MKILTSDLITRLQRFSNSIGNRVENEDWYDFITSSLNELKSNRTLPSQKRNFELKCYTDVVKNALPSDFNSFIKPSKNVLSGSSYDLRIEGNYATEKEFRQSSEVKFGIMFERDKKYLLSRQTGESDFLIDNLDDDSITYTLAGDASNEGISTETILGNGALVFDVTDFNNFFSISRTLYNSVDITDFMREGVATLFIKMPAVLDSLTLKIGNDSSNYYIITVDEQMTGDAFEISWNTIGFNLNEATEVGTVDKENVVWFEILGDNTGVTAKNFKLNGLNLRLPKILELPYNSKNIVETTEDSGIYQDKVDDVTNLIIWEDNFEDLLLNKVLEKSGFFKFRDIDMVGKTMSDYEKMLVSFDIRYPSNEETPRTRYYKMNNRF